MSEEDDGAEIMNPEEAFAEHGSTWYEVSAKHWEKQDHNISGMLGGYPEMNVIDILSSREILKNLVKRGMGKGRAADIAGGIGRVSLNVLAPTFQSIDLVEYIPSFVDEAKQALESKVNFRGFAIGAQDWIPDEKYDCIWAQWAIMYLMDDDAIKFLQRSKEALNERGYIIVRDNIANKGKGVPKHRAQYRELDNQLNRTYKHYLELFDKAGLRLVDAIGQKKWDPELLPVYTFILQ